MSVDGATLRHRIRKEATPDHRLLFAAAIVAASLLLLGTGFSGRALAAGQAMGAAADSVVAQDPTLGKEDAFAPTEGKAGAESARLVAEPDLEAAPALASTVSNATTTEEATVAQNAAARYGGSSTSVVGPNGWWRGPAQGSTAPSTEEPLIQGNAAVDPAAVPAAAAAEAPSAEQQASGADQARGNGGSASIPTGDAPAAAVGPQEPAPSGSGAFVALNQMETGMLTAINARRVAAGLKPVAIDPLLTEISRQRSYDMANRDYFSHTTPEGATFVQALMSRGISTGTVGEILGRNNGGDDVSVGMVVEAFTKSPSHNLHLVYQSYEWAGVGVAVGRDAMKYYTIIFRAPA